MSNVIEDVSKAIAKLILVEILARLTLWTGEGILFAVSLGHRKPRWQGYRGKGALRWVFSEMAVGLLGASFWVCAIKLGIELFA
jgi:hypothetical protein